MRDILECLYCLFVSIWSFLVDDIHFNKLNCELCHSLHLRERIILIIMIIIYYSEILRSNEVIDWLYPFI